MLSSARSQDGEQLLLEHALEFAGVADQPALHFFTHRRQHFAGGDGAEVGGDERGFQIVEGAGVDFLAEADDIFEALGEVLTGARDGLLHALKERCLLFLGLIEAAK